MIEGVRENFGPIRNHCGRTTLLLQISPTMNQTVHSSVQQETNAMSEPIIMSESVASVESHMRVGRRSVEALLDDT
jgi:hypothetical protein